MICLECKADKETDQFFVDNTRPRGRVARCKDCYSKRQKSNRILSPWRRYNEIRRNATVRGIAWNLSKDYYELMLWNAPCYFCGNPAGGGIDRLNNEPYYDATNSLACCGECNRMKGKMTLYAFLEYLQRVPMHLFGPMTANASIARGE